MKLSRSLVWCVATVLIAGLVSLAITRWAPRSSRGDSSGHSEANFHDWLHGNLEISAAQEAELLPIETLYEDRRLELREAIERAGQRLAGAIREHGANSPELKAAREDLNAAQGQLQQATLDHFFAMKEYLNPEQGEKLLQWTHDSILHGDHR